MTSDLDKDFNGEAVVTKVTRKILVYKKGGAILNFTKLVKLNLPPKVEHVTTIKPTLNFTYDELLNEEGDFYYEEDQNIDVREYSFFQNDYINIIENPISINDSENYQEYIYFFPKEKLDPFKVVGTEMVETPLGKLGCTIVEGIDTFDNKVKYWMINDKPGVFAKIIRVKDEDPPFEFANMYLLKEIN